MFNRNKDKENKLENSLINQLTSGVSQWTYRKDIKTNKQLWENFRQKLNQNNLAQLNGVEITDSEMQQIEMFMREQGANSYKAALWLAGEHGVAQIHLMREDASLGEVTLKAINNREVAGGQSCYEVINQFCPVDGDRDRRFDVSLLINGIPLIHIELKTPNYSYMEAFRQIQKYCEERQFGGLFGFVQMFVVSNESETRYIAANTNGQMQEKFLTRWVDENNEPIDNYLDFAKAVLNVPMAHLMVGKYAVIDESNHRQLLLRHYQVHAIQRVREASKERRSGYVWHTTGSGKTLTSYTVTKNLLDIPSVDKAIFLIDRKDLDRQTSDSFKSYAHNDDLDVDETGSTFELERKLTNRTRTAIVTTIQKLQNIIRKCTADNAPESVLKLKAKLQEKRLAFIIDECHRTVSPKTKRDIEKFFSQQALWFGFTGTPIFAENKREALGDLARTTEELYGKVLHKYTIKEALHDGAVLGFQIQAMGRTTETFRQIALDCKLYSESDISTVDPISLEQAVINHYKDNGRDLYNNDEHRNEVINYIVNKCAGKFNLSAGAGKTFEGMLTCGSIQEAQRYYKLFKKFKADGKVSEAVKSKVPDFPKIAITYSVGENEDGALANQNEMAESLKDYRKMFPKAQAFIDNIPAYNNDLNKRLARKESRYQIRDEQLDLVIVVDRLLTGFDSPCLYTIFMDRMPMRSQHLIQAFSRTNRIFTLTKRFGQIVTMQYPATYAKMIDDALVLYSNGGIGDVSAPTWEETKAELKKAIANLKEIVPSLKDAVEISATGDIKDLSKFIKAYQILDRVFSGAQVYDQFDESQMKKVFGMSREEIQSLVGHYKNAIERLRQLISREPPDEEAILVDVGYELEAVKFTEVNYKYVVALIQAHIPEDLHDRMTISAEDDAKVSRYIDLYKKNNQQIGEIVEQIWFEVKMQPEKFIGQDTLSIVQERVREEIDKELHNFSEKWAVTIEELNAVKDAWNGSDQVEVNGNYETFKQRGNTDSKLHYKKNLRTEANKLSKEGIKPFMRF